MTRRRPTAALALAAWLATALFPAAFADSPVAFQEAVPPPSAGAPTEPAAPAAPAVPSAPAVPAPAVPAVPAESGVPGVPGLPGEPGDPATTITAEEILEHVEVLASDLFEGREAGTLGERRAAAYIIDQLEQSPRLVPAGFEGGWLQPFPIVLHGQDAVAHNICALLPGTDPELAHETIVIGAHYDHVGFGHSGNTLDAPGEVHNGADDNASGSAVLLDLATSLAASGWQPRRSILFQWYSGEELGLLGSQHWCEHPLRPLRDTVFMLNMDMVGRLVMDTLLVGGTGTSPGLAELAREACQAHGLVMLDDPPGRAPSDNTSFYDRLVPVLFLFTGLHDDYHAAGDDTAKLDVDGAARIGRAAQRVLLAIDARDERPAFRPAPGEANIFRPHAYTGAAFGVLDGEAPPGPVEVTVVIPGSPAASAGLAEHDVVLALDGVPLAGGDLDARRTTLAALEARLKTLDEGLPPIVFRVVRDGVELDLSVKRVIR